MKKAISIFLAVVMVLALVACGNSAAPNAPAATNNGSETAGTDSDTIKIGYVSDLTGATALWGTAGQYGAELAVKDINEAGGVLGGKMLELVPMDGKGEAADSVSAFKKLVDEHHIVASIGTNFSSCNIPMASVADEVKVPIIGTAASNELVTVDENGNLHPYSFRMCFIDSYLGTVIGNYAVDKLGVKNAALFTIAGNTNSESVGSFIRDAINAKGANIVADEQCQEGDVDFRAQLTNIKAKNPDISFFVMNDYAKNATFAKQAREMGIECTLMGHDGWDSAQLASEAQGALEGCLYVSRIGFNSPDAKAFGERVAKEYGINHYRYHTACPPDAAFTAADLLGVYMAPELPFWGTVAEEGEEGYDERERDFLFQEGFRILREYGHHPSFLWLSLGNELWGSKDVLNRMMRAYREAVQERYRFFSFGDAMLLERSAK